MKIPAFRPLQIIWKHRKTVLFALIVICFLSIYKLRILKILTLDAAFLAFRFLRFTGGFLILSVNQAQQNLS